MMVMGLSSLVVLTGFGTTIVPFALFSTLTLGAIATGM